MDYINANINIELGFYNLWLILAILIFFTLLLMKIGDKMRDEKIENIEDHRNINVMIVSSFPILILLLIVIFVPIVIGPLFWIGCLLLMLAMIVYILSIMAFIQNKKGLITNGIYKFSRNPMYIALFLIFISFALMAWQAEPIIGIAILMITLLKIIIVHWMVLGEEYFLKEKYGNEYNNYLKKIPRYLGISKEKQS